MRLWSWLGGAVVLAGAAGITGVVVTSADGSGTADDPASAPSADEAQRSLVEVQRRDLTRSEQFDGTVGHGPSRPLVLAAAGTITGLPEPGTVLASGDEVAEIDGFPIVALDGDFPFWRALGAGVSDGNDVLQLEYALAVAGYAGTYGVTVDGDWSSATTRALKAFQSDHGQDDDGVVDLGEIVIIDGTARIDDVTGTPGQQAAEAGITVTSPDQSVAVALAVDDADLLAVGDTVTVELPTGDTVPGTVATIGAAETTADGTTTLPVTVSSSAPLADGTPVDVEVETAAAEGVLAVPVEALLALAEGGYAVEVVDDPAGPSRLVGVDLGVFADGMVEITGALEAGVQVVVP